MPTAGASSEGQQANNQLCHQQDDNHNNYKQKTKKTYPPKAKQTRDKASTAIPVPSHVDYSQGYWIKEIHTYIYIYVEVSNWK